MNSALERDACSGETQGRHQQVTVFLIPLLVTPGQYAISSLHQTSLEKDHNQKQVNSEISGASSPVSSGQLPISQKPAITGGINWYLRWQSKQRSQRLNKRRN